MTAEIVPWPRRPRLRLVLEIPVVGPAPDTAPASLAAHAHAQAQAHAEREIAAIAAHLHEATGCLGMLLHASVSSADVIGEGADAIEAALFHALTLKGCRNADRPLRNMLLARLREREVPHG